MYLNWNVIFQMEHSTLVSRTANKTARSNLDSIIVLAMENMKIFILLTSKERIILFVM